MTRKQYFALDWQNRDEVFYEWLDQYLADNGLPSFQQQGDYGHVDIVELRKEFIGSLV